MTPTEAGLDAIYLKLDASNDPVTAALEVNDSITISDAVNPQLILNDSGGTYDYKIESSADSRFLRTRQSRADSTPRTTCGSG
jgi:hypothetical protein